MNKARKDIITLVLKAVFSTILGLGIVIYLFRHEFSTADSIAFNKYSWITLILAICLMLTRDFAIAHRFRI